MTETQLPPAWPNHEFQAQVRDSVSNKVCVPRVMIASYSSREPKAEFTSWYPHWGSSWLLSNFSSRAYNTLF